MIVTIWVAGLNTVDSAARPFDDVNDLRTVHLSR